MANNELAPRALPSTWRAEQGIVELIDIGHASLNEPFFGDSISALRRSGGATVTRLALTGLRDLLAMENVSSPTGFIFHVGRCGSTLLANMIGSHPAVRAVKEPPVISSFLARTGLGHGSGNANDDILYTLIAAFGRGLHDEHFVLKFTGWTSVDIERILRLFPTTPAVFLWRPAIEVVTSWMARVPTWGQDGKRSQLARILNIERQRIAGEHGLISYFSHIWLAEASAAYDMARRPGSRVTTVTYADLRDNPRDVILGVSGHFRIPVSSSEVTLMVAQADRYSKDQSGKTKHDPQGKHFRPSLRDEQRAVVEEITGQQEFDLERLTYERGLRCQSG
jgi:hypothetical protein